MFCANQVLAEEECWEDDWEERRSSTRLGLVSRYAWASMLRNEISALNIHILYDVLGSELDEQITGVLQNIQNNTAFDLYDLQGNIAKTAKEVFEEKHTND